MAKSCEKDHTKKLLWISSLGLLIFAGVAAAASTTLGGMASAVTGSFTQITQLITGGSYLAGLAFSIAAIMKFKQHKDNPTQIPVGTPVALVFIAASFLFLPSILTVAGYTMFGTKGEVSSPKGKIFS